jgi:hypothetical protein
MGTSSSWNPQGLSRPVMGLIYLYKSIKNQNLATYTKCIAVSRQESFFGK